MRLLALLSAGLLAFAAQAQDKVILGMSGWTGFQPLKLAELAGIFKKNGVDIEIRFIAPVQRSAALASGALNAAATTVDQHIVWASAGIPSVQVALIDKSKGGDGSFAASRVCVPTCLLCATTSARLSAFVMSSCTCRTNSSRWSCSRFFP